MSVAVLGRHELRVAGILVVAAMGCGLVSGQAPVGAGKAQAVVIVVKDESGAAGAGRRCWWLRWRRMRRRRWRRCEGEVELHCSRAGMVWSYAIRDLRCCTRY